MADATPLDSLPSVVDWRKFLTDYPPRTRASVEGVFKRGSSDPVFALPELQLFCDGDCQDVSYCHGSILASGRLFPLLYRPALDGILAYTCSKCQMQVKSYAIRALGKASTLPTDKTADTSKLGEWPPFSFSTPSRVTSLIGPDRDLYLQGRKAESEGLGVGAFAYYRRIVEDQKNRLLDEIIRFARKTGASSEAISLLE